MSAAQSGACIVGCDVSIVSGTVTEEDFNGQMQTSVLQWYAE